MVDHDITATCHPTLDLPEASGSWPRLAHMRAGREGN